MLTGLRVLVVEREILIAIDLQRILENLGSAEVVLARAAMDATISASDLSAFGLALVDAQLGSAEAVALVRTLTAAGVPVIVASADADVAALFPPCALLEKPFTEQDLVAACTLALALARPAARS
jgi:DNA-binding response OmpR family regulator